MEAVLSGVSAGVIGLDAKAASRSPTARPRTLLGRRRGRAGRPPAARGGARVRGICCERPDRKGSQAACARQVEVQIGGEERTFAVRITSRAKAGGDTGEARSSPSTTSPSWSRPSAPRLGRRRAPHRPRDQEPADADTALGRAHASASTASAITRGPRDVRQAHRYHRAPGRRHQDHGRRVRLLRPHAQARDDPRPICATPCRSR